MDDHQSMRELIIKMSGFSNTKKKLAMTCINKKSGSWKYGSWRVTEENNGIKSIQ
jgi:hypothetical protein